MAARGLTDVHDMLEAGAVAVGAVPGVAMPEQNNLFLCNGVQPFLLVYGSCINAILFLTFFLSSVMAVIRLPVYLNEVHT
jgi:hypothetical protein